MTYQETLDLLFNMMPDFQDIGSKAYKPGLERVKEFDRYLGSPSKYFFTIHVAGTNGKGSVSHMIASILSEFGYCVGLYTSPHLKDFRERIKVDGKPISEKEVVKFTKAHLSKMEELDLSFFEATVGMAFSHFVKSRVEVAIIETGLGGRLDATNIITPILSVITNIGLEHTAFLGDSLESIAREKAGIIKPTVPVIIGEKDSHTDHVFKAAAANNGSKIFFAEEQFKLLEVEEPDFTLSIPTRSYKIKRMYCNTRSLIKLDLIGEYQRHNLLTVMATMEQLERKTRLTVSRRAIRVGLSKVIATTGLMGRWQVLSQKPLIIADTGHNAEGIKEIVGQIEKQSFNNLYVVLGVANDKDLSKIIPLLPKEAQYIFTQASVKRALPVEELAEEMQKYGLKGRVTHSVNEAYELAKSLAQPDDMIFIGGSTFVVADLP